MNESDSMDKNLWLAVALSVAVYAIWFGFFDKKVNPPKPAVPAASASSASATGSAAVAAPAPGVPTTPEQAKAAYDAADSVTLGDADARVASRGAALASYSFQGPISRVELVADPARGLFSTFDDLNFKKDEKAKSGLVFAATRADGVKVTKEFVPGQGSVLPRLVVIATNPSRKPVEFGAWTLTVGPGLGTVDSARKENAKDQRAIVLPPEAKHIEALKPGASAAAWTWLAVENRYFLAAVLPNGTQFDAPTVPAPATLSLVAKPVTLSPGGTFSWEIPYYLGPKTGAVLKSYGIGLEKSIDYGFFRDIGRPIFTSLKFLHGITGNWGWSIILLTLCLQLILSPLTLKSLKAAAAMRRLQPEVTKLQQRYKDDPTKLNTEMMALYSREGANPLGGCLPMLMQMPIFFALYTVLRVSWELHGAPWALWIHDLSAKDPFFVLPVVMGGLMFAQSKLNPPAGDPAQQQMMMFMPVIFTVMFAQASSGLVLYWLMNSLVSTVLQLALRDRLNKA